MSTIETTTVVEERPVALATGIIDEHDADVLMAVKALGDMRSQGAAPSSSSSTPLYISDSAPTPVSGATPAVSRSADSANASGVSISRPAQDDDASNVDFVSRVSTLPLVTSVLSAYSQSKASSRVVKYGAQMVESSVKTISRPVMDRLPTAQLDEFACRQLDRFEQRYGSRTDSPRDEVPRTPTPRSQPTPDADSGPGRGRSLERRIPGSAAGATLLRSPTPSATRDDNVPNQDAGSGVVVPAAATNDSDRQVANRSRWQAMLLEAGGIGAALSDESMKRLKYCLQWLQYATNRIDSQIAVLREFLESLSPGAGAGDLLLPLHMDSDAPVSPAALARLSAVKRDVVATIRQAVDIVSRYAGGALPEPARGTVRSVLLRLPERWASAGREPISDASGPGHRRTGSSSSARAPYPPRSTTPADGIHAARPGPRPQPTAGTAAQAAHRVMTLATESLDMMRGVTGVVKDSLDRAEVWVDRLRVVGLQRGGQGADEPTGAPDYTSSSSYHTGIPGTPALTSGSGSPRSLSMVTPLSPMLFPNSFRDALAQPRTQTHSVYSSCPSSTAVSTVGSDTETDKNEDVKPTLGHVRKKRRKGGGRDAKRLKDMEVDEDALPIQLPIASTPTSIELNSCPTLVAGAPTSDKSATEPKSITSVPQWLKYLLLAFFCLGQFLDTFNNSAVLPALPIITRSIDLTESDAVWLLAAYQATFASFLLISGRVSDVYSPKPVFIVGTIFFGTISLGAGFVNGRIVLIVLRALQGIGASLTIPSALGMLVQIFPEPTEQARAISMFAASAAIGNILGTIIGALFVQYASWRWVFWIIAVVALPIAIACIFLIPTTPRRDDTKASQLDFVGVSTLTAAIILFVYALTTGSVSPWASAGVLVPLFISVALVAAFFVWEARVDEKNAALPPKLWFYPNFVVLFAVALVPYFWWIQVYLTFVPYWQEVLHWSSIMTGVKFLSLAVTGGIITINGERISRLGRSKLLIIGGLHYYIMLPFSDKPHDKYWPLVFPALLIGTPGTATIFVLTNISFFRNTPPEYAGTVGAVFNAALQLGAAIGTSATTSIQATVDGRTSSGSGFTGRFAALWFLVAYIALEIVGVAVFYRDERSLGDLEAKAAATDPADVKGDTVVAT